jgi:hypothetical protein
MRYLPQLCVPDAIERDQRMSAKKVLYFVSALIALALIVGTTVLCLAADNTMSDRQSRSTVTLAIA